MSKYPWRCLTLWVVLVWWLCLSAGASGNVLTPVLAGEDLENGYVFTLDGLGEFSANVTSGETAALVMITLGEGLYATVHCDGTEISFDDGMFFEAGSYQVRIYSTNGAVGDYGLFTFSIASDFFGSLSSSSGEINWVNYPELTLSYNQDTSEFTYQIDSGIWFACNVPLGGRYNGVAQVRLSDELIVLATYLDGQLIATPDDLTFNQRGEYTLSLIYNLYGVSDDVGYFTSLSFTLGADIVADQTLLPSPYGFTLTDVTIDGVSQPVVSGDYVYLTQDGIYQLTYSGAGITYLRAFMRDGTAPYITFSVPMDGSVITDDITFTPSDPTATITMRRNNVSVSVQEYVIVQDGNYEITIADSNGNARTYVFTLTQSNDNWAGLLWIIPLAGGVVAISLLFRRITYFVKVL